MNRRAVALALALALVGCATSPPAASDTSDRSPDQTDGMATGSASAEPVDLEGHVLLTDGGLYVINADGSGPVKVHDEGDYCCINRVSPDRTSILVMPGDDFTGAVGRNLGPTSTDRSSRSCPSRTRR